MEDEIELRELIEILIKKKMTIAIFTLGAILLAIVYSFVILDPTYEAKMVLMTSNLGNSQTEIIDPAKVDDLLNIMTQYPDMNLETYRQQIKSPSVLLKTIEDLKLEDEYNIESLGNKINLETVKDTQLITIKMNHSDPEEAAEIINTLGNNFISFVTRKAKEKADKTFEYVETQMEVEKTQYEESLLELKEILSKPRGAQELSLELDSSFIQITEYKAKLNDLEVQRQGLISALAESKNSGGNGSLNARPDLAGGFNVSFDSTTKVLNVNLAETNGQIENIKTQIEDIGKHIEKIQVDYQDKSYEENIIRQRTDISKKTYESFVSKYEELRVAETAKVGELSINVISKAYPANTPVGPRKALNLAIGTVLGLMIGVFVAFFKEYWDNGSKEKSIDGDKIV